MSKILTIVVHLHYFPAYHMNMKYWLTVLLDNYVNLEQVKILIDESYRLVGNHK